MNTGTTVRLMVLTVLGAGLVSAGTGTAACSPDLKVLADHRAALAAQDWDAAACNFHPTRS